VVREKSGKIGKVRENELLQLFSCHKYCSDRNMQQWSSLLDKVVHQMLSERRNCRMKNVVVIDTSVYMSVAERNKCIFYIATVARGDSPSVFP